MNRFLDYLILLLYALFPIGIFIILFVVLKDF